MKHVSLLKIKCKFCNVYTTNPMIFLEYLSTQHTYIGPHKIGYGYYEIGYFHQTSIYGTI